MLFLRQLVDFHDGGAGAGADSADARTVGAGRKGYEEHGIFCRSVREGEGADRGGGVHELRVAAPIVVLRYLRARVVVEQFQLGIGHDTAEAEDRAKRGADAAHEDRASSRTAEHEANGEIGTGVDLREGREIDEARAGRGTSRAAIVDFGDDEAAGVGFAGHLHSVTTRRGIGEGGAVEAVGGKGKGAHRGKGGV